MALEVLSREACDTAGYDHATVVLLADTEKFVQLNKEVTDWSLLYNWSTTDVAAFSAGDQETVKLNTKFVKKYTQMVQPRTPRACPPSGFTPS